jgi:type IV secretion system protein VirB8
MRKFIESGEYFKNAKLWYDEIYIMPFVLRSWAILCASIIFLSAFVLAMTINSLYPLNKQIMYAIFVEDSTEFNAKIEPANFFEKDPYKSVSKIFIEKYILEREGYNYNDLTNRMLYVQNNSTKLVFNRYNDYLSIENIQSPVLRFQRYAKRYTEISDVAFFSEEKAVVRFNAKTYENTGRLIEDTDWEAEISFVIDKIDPSILENTPFSFIVSDYKVKLIRDNNVK